MQFNAEPEAVQTAVRAFVGGKVEGVDVDLSSQNIGRLLPQITEFIAHEADESRHMKPFLDRMDAFSGQVPHLGLDGSDSAPLEVLKRELTADESVLEKAEVELQMILDDLKRQLLGSEGLIDHHGSGDSKGSGDDQSPNREKDPDKPSTWRDSLNSQDDDSFDTGPASDDWKGSLGETNFSAGDPEAWKGSIGDDLLSDAEIARSARSEFDRDAAGDTFGYHSSLGSRIEAAEKYQAVLRGVRKQFEASLRSALLTA